MSSVVLISGTSSGIGLLAAETVARAGHTVYASMRNITTRNAGPAKALEQLARDHKLTLKTLEMDVSNTESVSRAVDLVMGEQHRIDVVINNAGLMSIGLAEGFTEEQMLHAINVNFMGPFRISRAVLPHFRAQGSGLLIHVTSIVGRLLFPGCDNPPGNRPNGYIRAGRALGKMASVFQNADGSVGIVAGPPFRPLSVPRDQQVRVPGGGRTWPSCSCRMAGSRRNGVG